MAINLYNELYSKLDENSTLGKRLRHARLKLNLSQEELALKCSLSRGALESYEKDIIHPSRNALFKLSKALDLKYICCDDYSKFLLSDYISLFKKWRTNNNLSMRAAAKKLGVPSSTYIAWENGQYIMSKKNYFNIRDKILQMST